VSTVYATLASGKKPEAPYTPVSVQFVDDSGNPITVNTGTVSIPKAAVTATVQAADANTAAGAAPTAVEFNAVVAALNETKKQLNALIGSLRACGLAASK
jgi:hypothetical protein